MGRSLGVSTTTPLPFAQCLASLRQLLSRSGFSVLSEIPFDREFEHHLGLGWKRYTVLLIWSPFDAYQAVLSEQEAGILIPFHLVVAEGPEGTRLCTTDVAMLGRLSGQIGLELLGGDIGRRMKDVYSDLCSQGNLSPESSRNGGKQA